MRDREIRERNRYTKREKKREGRMGLCSIEVGGTQVGYPINNKINNGITW